MHSKRWNVNCQQQHIISCHQSPTAAATDFKLVAGNIQYHFLKTRKPVHSFCHRQSDNTGIDGMMSAYSPLKAMTTNGQGWRNCFDYR